MPDRVEVQDMVGYYANQLLLRGHDVDTGHWQSLKNVPQTRTRELRNTCFVMPIPHAVEELQALVQPNMPWAEDHFLERVGGEPLNPGVQYKNWPWYRGNVERHRDIRQMTNAEVADRAQRLEDEAYEKKFSHTYMERYWPKQAGEFWGRNAHVHHPTMTAEAERVHAYGIRYDYGDLNDLVDLLVREPFTRQAYLPVWFPEDTGAAHGERVPCSLGYHFLLREGALHVNYFIRSCDLLRHFSDDVYLTARLCQWVLDQARSSVGGSRDFLWNNVIPGSLTMFMSSLHVFEGDLPRLRRQYG